VNIISAYIFFFPLYLYEKINIRAFSGIKVRSDTGKLYPIK